MWWMHNKKTKPRWYWLKFCFFFPPSSFFVSSLFNLVAYTSGLFLQLRLKCENLLLFSVFCNRKWVQFGWWKHAARGRHRSFDGHYSTQWIYCLNTEQNPLFQLRTFCRIKGGHSRDLTGHGCDNSRHLSTGRGQCHVLRWSLKMSVLLCCFACHFLDNHIFTGASVFSAASKEGEVNTFLASEQISVELWLIQYSTSEKCMCVKEVPSDFRDFPLAKDMRCGDLGKRGKGAVWISLVCPSLSSLAWQMPQICSVLFASPD